MKLKAPVLHIFEQPIYPRELCIIDGYDKSFMDDNFEFTDGCSGFFETQHALDNYKAVVFGDFQKYTSIRNKKNEHYCIPIALVDKKLITVRVAAHEATHAALQFWKQIGESPTGIEADACLVGWIADCIWQVKTGIFNNS